MAERFAAEGADLALIGRDTAALSEVADIVRAAGRRAWVHVADLADVEQAQTLVVRAVEALGHVDILVNNAGRAQPKHLMDVTVKDWDEIFAVNARGPFFCLQAAARQMIAQGTGGKVINISSGSGKVGSIQHGHYGATKAAMNSYTRSAALALARHRINVNTICPGIVDTPMWTMIDRIRSSWTGDPPGTVFRASSQRLPLGRAGTPSDIAAAAVFLASTAADYITGQTLNVDGGGRMD
jgi:D-sorbitol dehydrogenase (acceptor)